MNEWKKKKNARKNPKEEQWKKEKKVENGFFEFDFLFLFTFCLMGVYSSFFSHLPFIFSGWILIEKCIWFGQTQNEMKWNLLKIEFISFIFLFLLRVALSLIKANNIWCWRHGTTFNGNRVFFFCIKMLKMSSF